MEGHIKKRDGAIILFKALSIYSFIVAIEYFADRFPNIFNYKSIQNNMTVLQAIAPIIFMIIGGFIIWWLSPVLASFMFESPGPDEKYEFTAYDIQIIAFSVVGLLYMTS